MLGIIAVTNQKGGVGKTTTTVNVGAALARNGNDVLLVGVDPQGNLAEATNMNERHTEEGRKNLYDVLVDQKYDLLDELTVEHDEFDVVPAHRDMFAINGKLVGERGARQRLGTALETVKGLYDWILLDNPANMDMLSDSSIMAADAMLMVCQAQDSSIGALETLFIEQIDELEQAYNIDVPPIGLVVNMVQHNNESEDVLDILEEQFSNTCPVMPVRDRVAIQRAWTNGRSIFEHTEECDQQEQYINIAESIEEGV